MRAPRRWNPVGGNDGPMTGLADSTLALRGGCGCRRSARVRSGSGDLADSWRGHLAEIDADWWRSSGDRDSGSIRARDSIETRTSPTSKRGSSTRSRVDRSTATPCDGWPPTRHSPGQQPVEPRSTNGPLVVTEGIPDALIATGAGMQSVGVLGSTAPSRHVAEQLKRSVAHRCDCGSSIVICFDADQPGRSAAARLAGLLHECETEGVTIVEPPDGMDITDCAATGVDWTRKLVGGPAERRHRDLSHASPSTETDIDFGP